MQVIAITGGKGGVGKTNIAVNLSISMARDGHDVLLLDADLGLANIDVVLGINVAHTMADVIDGRKTLAEIVITGPEGVRIIPGASGVAKLAELGPAAQNALVRSFSDELASPDVLIVDTGAGVDSTVQTFVSACKTVVVVVNDEPASLTDAYALMKIMRNERGVRRFDILANQVDTPMQGRSVYDRITRVTDQYLDVDIGYLGAVPSDPYLKRAVQERTALMTAYPRAPAADAIRQIARQLMSAHALADSGRMSFFVEALFQSDNTAARS